MKQVSVAAAFIMTLATALAGCASETTGSNATGGVEVNLIIGNTDVTAVNFEVVCDSGMTLSGQFNVNDEQDPPIFSTIMDLSPGDCTITLIALDDAGAVLCTGSKDFTVLVDQTITVDVVLMCGGDGDDPLGNVNISATFEEVEGNNCPRLHFLNAVPDEVPAEGSAVTVLVSDKDGDVLTTALTATGGSFADPTALSTTYTCDDASGSQTMFVTVSDGEAACDKSTSFDVTCPGDNNLCEGKTCDAGNQCVAAECNEATGDCETSNVGSGVGCELGELTTNGGFELGNLEGWTLFCTENNGTCAATTAENNGGLYSGNLVAGVPNPGDPASFPLIKQERIGVGTVAPNSPITVSFDLFGLPPGPGGVVIAELISEFAAPGGTNEILGGGPLFPNAPNDWTAGWVTYTFDTTTGNDVDGGVSLLLKADCGGVVGCTLDVYFDNVSVVYGSGAGTCDGQGTCVPIAGCSVPADCPDDGNECTDAVCDAGTCGTSNNTNVCDGGNGTCSAGVCVPDAECSVPGDCTDDGNECTDAVCDAGTCGTSNNTNVCDGGAGTCDAGVCEPNAEVFYQQNFNLLPIDPGGLIGDGWKYFINVFEGDETYRFGYGGDAPQGPQISNLVTTEGGAEQEPQQLVVYSDYECCAGGVGHQNPTDLVETNVFQERTIGAADVGKTFTFMFQAKGGNLAGSTTANGFIKTLRPPSFGESAVDRADTTGLPATWGGFTVSITIPDDTFIGDVLQFGFQTNASNGEDSGNFYDNVLVTN